MVNITKKLEIDIDKKEPITDFRKAIQYHLTEKEQKKLVNKLLKTLPEVPEMVEKYAKNLSNTKKENGYVNATPQECWVMAKQDFKREKKDKKLRIFTQPKK